MTCCLSTTGRRSSKPVIAPPVSQRSIMCAARRPSPTARVMSVGPVTTSPAAKMCGTPVWSVSRSAIRVPLPLAATLRREGARVGGHADGHDHGLAVEHVLAAGHRLRPAAPDASGSAERHARAATARARCRARHRAPRGAPSGSRSATPSCSASSTSASWAGISVASAAVRDAHRASAQSPCGPRSVDRDVAATDHHDPLVRQVRRLAEADGPQELDPAGHARAILAGDVQARRAGRPGRQQDGVVALGTQRVEVGDRAGSWRSPRRCRGRAGCRAPRPPPAGDRPGSRGAGSRRAPVPPPDPDAVALARQLPGRGQARRPGADDRDPLPVGGCDARPGAVSRCSWCQSSTKRLSRRIGSVPSRSPRVQAASQGA